VHPLRRQLTRAARAGIVLSVAVIPVVLWACQASRPPTSPGALPTARIDVAPRVNASTYVAHGHLLEQQGELEQAVTQYRQALQLAPDLLTAHIRLGITLNKLGRHAEASTEFRAAAARNGSAAFVHNDLGFSLYLEGKYDEAEQVLARAVELQPSFRRAHMNHGLALAKLGRYDEALAAFCLAATKPDAYYDLAVMQSEAGDYAAAAQALQNALALNPQFDEARQLLREVARLAAAQEAERAACEAERAAAEAELPDEAPAPAEVELASDAEAAVTDVADMSEDVAPAFEAGSMPEDAALQLLGIPPNVAGGIATELRSRLVMHAVLWAQIWQRVQCALGTQDQSY
jgi:Flp pilus assembly protein TadD